MYHKAECTNCIDNKKSIFYSLLPDEKDLLFKNHTCSSYKKGEIIYKEGDKPTGLICLSHGKVKVFKEGVGGREQIIKMTRPISFIGYRALFAGDNYISSAIAIEDSSICVISRDSIFRLIRTNGELALKMIRMLAVELGFSNNRTVTLTQKHIRGRLAESLLFLRDTYGFEDDEKTIKVYLSREDVANLSNMTTSNAIRTLSAFAGERVIEVHGRKIQIVDAMQLQEISTLG